MHIHFYTHAHFTLSSFFIIVRHCFFIEGQLFKTTGISRIYILFLLRTYVNVCDFIYFFRYLCTYLCTYVPMYVCNYVPIYVCNYVPMYLCMYLSIYVRITLTFIAINASRLCIFTYVRNSFVIPLHYATGYGCSKWRKRKKRRWTDWISWKFRIMSEILVYLPLRSYEGQESGYIAELFSKNIREIICTKYMGNRDCLI